MTLGTNNWKRARHFVCHARQENLEKKMGKGFVSVTRARQVSTRPTLPARGVIHVPRKLTRTKTGRLLASIVPLASTKKKLAQSFVKLVTKDNTKC